MTLLLLSSRKEKDSFERFILQVLDKILGLDPKDIDLDGLSRRFGHEFSIKHEGEMSVLAVEAPLEEAVGVFAQIGEEPASQGRE
jgi:hypothetical protein